MKTEVALRACRRLVAMPILAEEIWPLRFQNLPRLDSGRGPWSSLHQNEQFLGIAVETW